MFLSRTYGNKTVDYPVRADLAVMRADHLRICCRVCFTEMVNTNSIPLSFDYKRPNGESLRSVRETQEMIASGSGESYSTGRDLIEAALV